ncbi:MAG: hypothetical protein KDC00_12450 [Flavobacteriales bacterium]|nr:hypothetical protein [Flavobacteriales bacterium]
MATRLVDIAINAYGKSHQTAVTLLSLLRHSGQHIRTIRITLERRQPFDADFVDLLAHLGDRATIHRPRFWFGTRPTRTTWLLQWRPYRHSLRYQYAWETSDRPFLFVTHNDVKYTGDIIGAMLDRIPGHVAIGPVGQCWNCPAALAQHCGPDSYSTYRPNYTEWKALAAKHPGPRAAHYHRVVDPNKPWPLPECRVNEWSMLVDMRIARPLTMPFGDAVPLGALYGLDVGTQWFHDVLNNGERIAHFDIAPYAAHAWASVTGGGHAALVNKDVYDAEEERAWAYLTTEFPEYVARKAD